LDEIEIRLGQYIRLAPNGPVVPIDESGRLAIPPAAGGKVAAIPAAELIDAPDDLLDGGSPPFAMLIDERPGAETATHAFSRSLPAVMAVIAGDAGLAPAVSIRRIDGGTSLLCLAAFCMLVMIGSRLPAFSQSIAFIGLAAVAAIAQFSAVAVGWWLPGLPAVAALAVALLICHVPPLRRWIGTR